MQIFALGSSAVDWCENNYHVTSFIAEFFNTVTNVLFFIIPPIMLFLYQNYAKFVSKGVNIIWFFLMIIGMGSTYFHATLTMAGQLMDELSILWVLMTGYSIFFPEKLLPAYFQKNRNIWYVLLGFITICITFLCFLNPILNAYFLMIFSIPIIAFISYLLKGAPKIIKRLGNRIFFAWFLAVFFWLIDRVFCNIWLKIGIPYFHAVFHILIFIASHKTIVLYSYFTAQSRVPNLKPILVFWPSSIKNEYLAIPYIDFEFSKSNNKRKSLISQHKD